MILFLLFGIIFVAFVYTCQSHAQFYNIFKIHIPELPDTFYFAVLSIDFLLCIYDDYNSNHNSFSGNFTKR